MKTMQEAMDEVFAEPFRPFRIHTASGQTFEVRHPEDVRLGRSIVAVYTTPGTDPKGSYCWEKISLSDIESIGPLDAALTSGS